MTIPDRMDCYDAVLLLARPEEVERPSPGLADHVAGCGVCHELRANLAGETDLVPPDDDLIGREVGPYRIRSAIGAGGMGRVYRAVHSRIEAEVAIKVLSNKAIESDHLVSRFFAEARAAGVIKHENIVNTLDVGRLDDGRPYLIMEYLPGQPLSALIGQPRLTDELARDLALDVLAALEATHAIDIVHRDLKPDNIYVSPEGRATLLDFGIAKLVPEISGEPMRTMTGQILGTPHYMSPEQAAGDAVDGRADLYSMGVILYECFTGRRPFAGTSFYHLVNEHHNRPPRPPSQWRRDLGDDLEAIILKALAKRPSERFQSAGAMRAALLDCDASTGSGGFNVDPAANENAELEPTAATVSARPMAAVKRPRKLALGLVLAAAALLVAVVAFVATRQDRSAAVHAIGAGVDAGNSVIGRANLQDAAPVLVDAESLVDAVPVLIDAAPVVVKPVTPVVKKRPRGVRPLSRLAEATKLALDVQDDAILTRIEITGLDENGFIHWTSARHEVKMYFYSPSLVAHYAEKRPGKISRCGVKAIFKGSKPLEVGRAWLRCHELRPLPTPRCSMAEVLRRARKKAYPKGAAPKTATLRVAPRLRAKATWRLVFEGVNYGQPSC